MISHDYFKYVLFATIQNFFGGRLVSYESVVERARRKPCFGSSKKHTGWGKPDHGVRLSTTELGMQGGMVEVFGLWYGYF